MFSLAMMAGQAAKGAMDQKNKQGQQNSQFPDMLGDSLSLGQSLNSLDSKNAAALGGSSLQPLPQNRDVTMQTPTQTANNEPQTSSSNNMSGVATQDNTNAPAVGSPISPNEQGRSPYRRTRQNPNQMFQPRENELKQNPFGY